MEYREYMADVQWDDGYLSSFYFLDKRIRLFDNGPSGDFELFI